jgi:uncharacterized protein YbjT (DUF2867 family)
MEGVADLRTVVVLGATGKQGGGVARALIAAGGWRLRTISRKPGSLAARRLASLGVEVVAANLDDPGALAGVFKGAYGVYSVQSTDEGSDVEERRGIAVADAALSARVEHFVYASVGGADRQSGIPHFDSKWRIETHVRKIGLPATIIRPAFFMDNLLGLPTRLVLLALMRSYVPGPKTLQMIAVEDIGKFVARVFAEHAVFIGKAVEIAGDELTFTDIAAALRKHQWSAGLPCGVPRFLLRVLPNDALKMFEWFGQAGYRADVRALRAVQPDLMTFEDWLSALTNADLDNAPSSLTESGKHITRSPI